MGTHTTVNITKGGVRYPAGTPIEDLPEVCRAALEPSQVDGPLEEPASKKRQKRTKPPTEPEPPAPADPPADATGEPPAPPDDDAPF